MNATVKCECVIGTLLKRYFIMCILMFYKVSSKVQVYNNQTKFVQLLTAGRVQLWQLQCFKCGFVLALYIHAVYDCVYTWPYIHLCMYTCIILIKYLII